VLQLGEQLAEFEYVGGPGRVPGKLEQILDGACRRSVSSIALLTAF